MADPTNDSPAPVTLASLDARVRAVADAVAALSDEAVRPDAFAVMAAAGPDCRWELELRLKWAVEHLQAIGRVSRSVNRAMGRLGTDGSRGPYPAVQTAAAIAALAAAPMDEPPASAVPPAGGGARPTPAKEAGSAAP